MYLMEIGSTIKNSLLRFFNITHRYVVKKYRFFVAKLAYKIQKLCEKVLQRICWKLSKQGEYLYSYLNGGIHDRPDVTIKNGFKL